MKCAKKEKSCSASLPNRRHKFPVTSIIFLAKSANKKIPYSSSVMGFFIFVFYLKNLILFATLVNRTCGNRVNLLKVTPLWMFLSGSPTNERKRGPRKTKVFWGEEKNGQSLTARCETSCRPIRPFFDEGEENKAKDNAKADRVLRKKSFCFDEKQQIGEYFRVKAGEKGSSLHYCCANGSSSPAFA